MSFITYNRNNAYNIACKYVRALYKSAPENIRSTFNINICSADEVTLEDKLDIPLPWDWVVNEDPPKPWDLGDILKIIWDPLFFWDEECEPREMFISGVLGGPLDKSSFLICPVAPEPGFSGDAALLRQHIGYYHHLMRARTYYINICSGSKLYWSYKLYLHTRFPETYSFDFADLSDATSLIIEDTMINNIIDPPALLAAWKSQYAPLGIGPSFVEWLTSNIYEPQGNMCALGLDMLDFIIPFIGIQDCQTISLTDSWWTSYNADSAISSDLGASANPIDIGQNKFITDSLSNTPPIPAHRISWNDAWYPFTNFLQSSINTFSSSIVASLKYGPKVTASQSVTCMQIGISCVNDICVENVNKCLSDLLGGVFNPNINICETYTCTSSSSSGSGSSSGSSTNSGSGVGSGSGSGSASATVCEDCSSLMNNRCHTLNITLDNLYTSPPYNPEDPFSQPQTRRSFTPVFPITFTGDSYYNSTIQTNYSLGYLTVNASITCSIEINPSTLLQRPYITLSVTATLPNTATASCREEYDVILDTISFSSNFYGSDCLDGTYNIDGPQYLTANTSNCSSTYPAPTISCSWNIGQKDSPCS